MKRIIIMFICLCALTYTCVTGQVELAKASNNDLALEQAVETQIHNANDYDCDASEEAAYISNLNNICDNFSVIELEVKAQTESKIESYNYISNGFSFVSASTYKDDTLYVSVSHENTDVMPEFFIEISLTNGSLLIAAVYGYSTEYGLFLSQNSHDHAKDLFADYLKDKGIINREEYDKMYAERTNSSGKAITSMQINNAMKAVNAVAEYSNDEVEYKPSLSMLAAATYTYSFYGYFSWVDNSNIPHGLQYTKVEIYKRGVTDNTLLATGYTGVAGVLTVTLTNIDATANDIFVRIYPAGRNTQVVRPNGEAYYWESSASDNTVSGTRITISRSFTMSDDLGKAFQVSQAACVAATYVYGVNSAIYLPAVTIQYPHAEENTGCFYRRSTRTIYITGRVTTGIQSYESWDVIMHEYGHHVQYEFGIINSPGGTHYINYDMADYYRETNQFADELCRYYGLRIAYSEAWATYFGTVAQQHAVRYWSLDSSINTVGDERYTAYNGVNINLETPNNSYIVSECCESTVMAVLYDMYDEYSSEDNFDELSLGTGAMWRLTTQSGATTLYELVEYFNFNYSDSITALTKILNHHKIAPAGVTAQGISSDTPTISWNYTGSSEYYEHRYLVYFYTSAMVLRAILPTAGATSYTFNSIQWESLKRDCGSNINIFVRVFVKEFSDPIYDITYDTAYDSEWYTITL